MIGIKFLEPINSFGLSQFFLAVESPWEMESIGLQTREKMILILLVLTNNKEPLSLQIESTIFLKVLKVIIYILFNP